MSLYLLYWDPAAPTNHQLRICSWYSTPTNNAQFHKHLSAHGRIPLYSGYSPNGTIVVKPRNFCFCDLSGSGSDAARIRDMLAFILNPSRTPLCDFDINNYPEILL